MKKSILFVVAVACGVLSHGQNLYQGITSNNGAGLDLNLYQNTSAVQGRPLDPNIDGSRYFMADDFMPALITIAGTEQSTNSFVQYDVYGGVMKFASDKQGTDAEYLSQANNIIISLNNKKFQFIEATVNGKSIKNYAEIVSVYDNNSKLAIVHTKDLKKPANDNKGSYGTPAIAKLVDDKSFYYIDSNGIGFEVNNSKNGVLKNIDKSKKDDVSKFIKTANIAFDDNYQGLSSVMKYYSSL